ncbi:helix-turn-helix domain-containing protein [Palleronia sediminis]|uniref:helix-turn-helix domain-containing protein n=1 Tax=Palleronia sediminis TaxID=2547833 RepID=UPI0034E03ADA
MPFINRVSTEDLVLFSEVARLRNFSHAAERLGLAPPDVLYARAQSIFGNTGFRLNPTTSHVIGA